MSWDFTIPIKSVPSLSKIIDKLSVFVLSIAYLLETYLIDTSFEFKCIPKEWFSNFAAFPEVKNVNETMEMKVYFMIEFIGVIKISIRLIIISKVRALKRKN